MSTYNALGSMGAAAAPHGAFAAAAPMDAVAKRRDALLSPFLSQAHSLPHLVSWPFACLGGEQRRVAVCI